MALNCWFDFLIWRRIGRRYGRRASLLYLLTACLTQALLIVALCLPSKGGGESEILAIMWLFLAYFSVYIPKAIYCLSVGIASLPRLFHRRPWRGVATGGAVVGVGVFLLIWWSALVTRVSPRVTDVDIPVADLPAGLDGLRIVQISDLHTGTYGDSNQFLCELVERINALNPDLVCFTGDIVNRHTAELLPHWKTLAGIKAPVVAILGNHDYGDYYRWESPAAKEDSRRQLRTLIADSMQWRLLLDERVMAVRQADTLDIVGVENIGEAPFPTYGSLQRANPRPGNRRPTLLLTHNPRHWNDSIANHPLPAPYFLTLSGHTHAMQMAVGRWSPAAWRYPQWGGLYADSLGQRLYVNIGTGTVGVPIRVGDAQPEITLLTLHKQEHPSPTTTIKRPLK